jgi:hypothetical protein
VVDGCYDRECVVAHGAALFQHHGRYSWVEFGVDGCMWISRGWNKNEGVVGEYGIDGQVGLFLDREHKETPWSGHFGIECTIERFGSD